MRRYTRAATQKIENLTNRDQNIRGNLHTVLTALSRNRRAADLVDTIQPVFRLYEQTCLSESSLWYRKRPGKRTKAAPVLVQETEADTAAAAKAAALLRSEYGRGAIAAYVQGWLGESDVCRSEDIPLENDKDYLMRLLAVLTVFENHSILQRIEGKFNQADCRFAILPTIQTAVSSERLNEVAAVLRKEETADEETEEDSAD